MLFEQNIASNAQTCQTYIQKNTTHIHTTAHPKYEHTQGNIQGNPYEPAKPKKTQSFRFSQKVLPKKEDGKKNKEGFRFASNI